MTHHEGPDAEELERAAEAAEEREERGYAEREREERAEREREPYEPGSKEDHLRWLAKQTLRKVTPEELAAEQTILIDARAVGPRDEQVERKSLLQRGLEAVRRVTVNMVKGIDGVELLEKDFPPMRWIVPGLIPEGTTLLAAPPKIGKSGLAYQLCVAVALGGELLGRQVTQGRALYLALEDSPRRAATRLRNALSGRTLPGGKLSLRWNADRIGDGLEEQLREWIDLDPATARLIIIDTLERVRPDADVRKNAYRVDVQDLSALQSAFRDTDVAMLIIHHARKEHGDDFVQAVSGTYGLTGTVDTILSIERKRNDPYAMLRVTGREVEEAELPIRMVGDGLWALSATNISVLQAAIYEAIQEQGPIWPAEIARKLGKQGEAGRVSVQRIVSKLVTDGAVERGTGGYTVTIEPQSNTEE